MIRIKWPYAIHKVRRLELDVNVTFFTNAGAPSNGTTGAGFAGKGSLCSDSTNGILYINTNTMASPTWVKVGLQT